MLRSHHRTVDSVLCGQFGRVGPRKHEAKVRKSTKRNPFGPRKHEIFLPLVLESTSLGCFRTTPAAGINHLRKSGQLAERSTQRKDGP